MSITWQGMRELDRDFAVLERLEEPVAHDIERTSQQAFAVAQAGYPADSLRQGLRLTRPGRLLARIRQTAPHGHLYELGTTDRFRRTGAATGRMPANPVLIRAAAQARAGMVARFERLLSDAGALGLRMLEGRR